MSTITQIREILTKERKEIRKKLNKKRKELIKKLDRERKKIRKQLTKERKEIRKKLDRERKKIRKQLTKERKEIRKKLDRERKKIREKLLDLKHIFVTINFNIVTPPSTPELEDMLQYTNFAPWRSKYNSRSRSTKFPVKKRDIFRKNVNLKDFRPPEVRKFNPANFDFKIESFNMDITAPATQIAKRIRIGLRNEIESLYNEDKDNEFDVPFDIKPVTLFIDLIPEGDEEDVLFMGNNPYPYIWADETPELTNIYKDCSCVEAWFLNTFKSKKKSRRSFNNSRSKYYMNSQILRQIANPILQNQKYVYNINMVKKLCEYYNFPMWAFRIDGSLISSWIPPIRNGSTNKAVVFVCSDNHFYPVISSIISKFLSNKGGTKSIILPKNEIKRTYYKTVDKYKISIWKDGEKAYKNISLGRKPETAGFNPKIIELRKKIYNRLSQNELNKIFMGSNVCNFSLRDNKITKVTCIEKKKKILYGAIYPTTKYGDHKDLLNDYRKCGIIPPASPSPIDLGNKLMPDITQCLHEEYCQVFRRNPTMYHFTKQKFEQGSNFESESDLCLNFEAYDINHHYRKSLNNNFINFDLTSRYEKYNPKKHKNTNGYYLGYHKDLGYCWCPFKEDLTNITYILTAGSSNKNPKGIMNKPFQNFIKITENTKYKKSITNLSIGCLGKIKSNIQISYKTRDEFQTYYLYNQGYEIISLGSNQKIAVKNIETDIYRTAVHIRSQIIWYAYKNLEKLMNKFEYIHSIKTDSVCGIPKKNTIFPEKLYKNDLIHNVKFRESNISHLPNKSLFSHKEIIVSSSWYFNCPIECLELKLDSIESNDKSFINETLDLSIDLSKSVLILGLAGSGKTKLLIDKIYKVWDPNDVEILSPTNLNAYRLAQACNGNGKTIEKFASSFIKNKKCYVIDEGPMCSYQDFEILYLVKKRNPKAVFIGSGDPKQLKNADGCEIVYNKKRGKICPEFLRIFNNNIHWIHQNHRNNLDYSIDYKDSDFNKLMRSFMNYNVHLCWFNKTRVNVNQALMIKNKKQTSKFIKKNSKNRYGQDIFLYDNLPIRFINNLPKKKLFNGTLCIWKNIKKKITQKELMLNCVPAYCLTLYGIQGETIKEKYVIHDSDYIFKDYTKKYVAYSRCIDKNNIYLN